MLSVYPAIFCKEDNGYSVLFPDLNWLATCGDTLEEAMAMAVDCLAGYLYECRKGHESVPAPSKMTDLLWRNILSTWYPWTWNPTQRNILKNLSKRHSLFPPG